MAECVAITYYALTSDYMERLAAAVGRPVSNMVVSSLRGRGAADILLQLRRSRFDTVYLPVPSRDWQPFLPMLCLVARLPKSRRVVILDADFQGRELSLAGSVLAGLQLALRALAALVCLLPAKWSRKRLMESPRVDAPLDRARSRILYLKTNMWTGVMAGGSVSHTVGVIRGLTGHGHLVTYTSPSEAPELAGMPGLSLQTVPVPYGYTYPRELNNYRYDRTLARWARHLEPGRFGFIYHRLSLGAAAAVALSRRLRIPLVLEYNGSEVWIAKHWGNPLRYGRLAELTEEACLRHAHLIVTVSEPLRRELIERGIEPARIITQPNGFDPEAFDPSCFTAADIAATRRQLGIAEDAVVATFVGTFGPWHGADVLGEALVRLAYEQPARLDAARLHVLFIGDGMNKAETEARLASFPALVGRYTFTGLVPPQDTPALLAASDLFVAPHVPNPDGTEFFGSPTKLFEYMGMSRPTVASALGQIAEVMEGAARLDTLPATDGPAGAEEAGILVTPGDVGELARALMAAADRPVWRRSAGANARARALARFTWSNHVGGVLARLGQVCPTVTSKPRPVKVLVNAVHAKSGGGVTYLNNLLPALAARPGVTVELAIQADQTDTLGELSARLTTHVLPTVSRLKTVLCQEQLDIPRLAARIGADVIFSPANYGPLLGGHNVILLRNAFEVGSLERRLSKRLYWLAVRVISELCFRTSRRTIVVSRHAGNRFLKAFRLPSDARMEVVHHGVSPLFSPPQAGERRVPGLLLAVSDIYVQKNLETLIAALALLAPSRPEVHLKVAGRPLDDEYFQRLRTMCAELGVSDRVTFLGGVPAARVADLYRRASVFVFPSLVETFGNPLLEAMASGIPIVCSRAAALPEVAGDAALFAAPGDAAHMAEQIGRLLDDPELAARLSERGLARVRDFSWDRAVDATLEVLSEAAGR